MYEKMLYEQYKSYSYEELKEITVANGYTEKAEQIARQLLSERKAEPEENMETQKRFLTSQDVLENSDSGMITKQINQMLYDEYKTYSQEELKEITYANGYTEEAEQIARQLLGENVMESKEDTDASDEELKKHEKDVVYCINCGAECQEGARFCMECGFKIINKEQMESESTRDNDVAINPDHKKLGKWLSFVVVFLIVIGVSLAMLTNFRHDLSGMYQTTEFFPFNQIEFDKGGNFTAVYYNGSYTETYDGKYRKKYNGEYICRFTGGSSSGGNPISNFNADNMDTYCEFGMKKVDENTLEVWIIPKVSYYAWNGVTVFFYKQ